MAIRLADFGRIAQTQPRDASLDPDPSGQAALRATPKGLGHRIAGVFKNLFTARKDIQDHAAPKQQLANDFRAGLRQKYGVDVANRALARFQIDPMRSLKVGHVLKGLGGVAAEHHAASTPALMKGSLIDGKPFTFSGKFPTKVQSDAMARVAELSGELTGGTVSQPPGRPKLADSFYKDHVTRADPINIKHGDVVTTIGQHDDPDPADALTTFAGSATRAEGLSHLMHQGALVAFVGARAEMLAGADGAPVIPMGAESKSYTLSRASNGDFVIDYRLDMQPDQLHGGEPALPLDPASSHIGCTMQILITAADLDAGNGRFTISQPPSVDMRLQPDWARLAS